MEPIDKIAFEQMKQVDVRTIDKASLVDLAGVKIDRSLPVNERLAAFAAQINNPYCFRVGNVAVKVVYKEFGPSFQQNMEDLLRMV